MTTTVTDLQGAQPPFLLYVLMTRGHYAGDIERHWVLVRSVASLDEGLQVASNMATCYQYRLHLGETFGYVYLDWSDDGDGLFSPYWSDEPRDTSKAV